MSLSELGLDSIRPLEAVLHNGIHDDGTVTHVIQQSDTEVSGNVTVRQAQSKQKQKQDRHLSERHVTLRNDLVGASHGLKTLAEHRIVKAAAAKLDSVRLDQGRYKIRLTAAEYAETFSLDANTAYEQLKTVSKSLLNRTIRREEPDRRGLKVHLDHWVSGITYHEGEAWLELRFSHEAMPYLTLLRGKHTTYRLKQAAGLRSGYSWRLLEMLMQFKDTGWKQVDVELFAKAMDAKPSHLKNFKDLRCWVIDPAIKELTTKDGWSITWKAIKAGRKVIALRFDFKRDQQAGVEG
jgi:plasmid replication initiation protein